MRVPTSDEVPCTDVDSSATTTKTYSAPLKSNCRHASYNATAAALDKFRLRLPATIGSFKT
jgi:hypothetical protein